MLLGAWLAGSLAMIAVATQNFRSVDRLLAAPSSSAVQQIETLGPAPARAFLRYLVAEQNRFYFENWEKIQLGLGILLLLTLLMSGSRPAALVCLLMLAAVAIMHWLLTPQIVELGRAIDFLPAGQASEQRIRFWDYHGAYSATELVKLGLGVLLAGMLLVGRRRSQGFGNKIKVVDHADHSHVDG